MRFHNAYRSAVPPRDLFLVHRDELETFGPRLLGVEKVERTSTERDGSVYRLEHRWTGDLSVMPRPLQIVVPSRLFVWEDHSTWDEATLSATWQLRSPILGPVVHAEGTHRFAPCGEGSRVTIEGDLYAAAAEALGSARVDEFLQDLLSRVVKGATPIIEDYALHSRRA